MEKNHVDALYVRQDSLSIRIALHDKYSENSYGFHNWLFDRFHLKAGDRVLDVGCGTGRIWQNRALPEDVHILLADFSPLMVEKSSQLLGHRPGFSFQQMDIQALPLADDAFDIVIANHMLYHVPDLMKGLSEVWRVLKPGGAFFASTVGEDNMRELGELYNAFPSSVQFVLPDQLSFTLENGEALLKQVFKTVSQSRYPDALRVTSQEDLMAYILSYNSIPEKDRAGFQRLLASRFEDGVFRISKSQGVFCCRKDDG